MSDEQLHASYYWGQIVVAVRAMRGELGEPYSPVYNTSQQAYRLLRSGKTLEETCLVVTRAINTGRCWSCDDLARLSGQGTMPPVDSPRWDSIFGPYVPPAGAAASAVEEKEKASST